ncbi:ATP-binding protein [Microtetraspora glauca]|uniref:AAA family ATPase n=1 Tax=Microtetraspora glauca TaxID=1996 RepID=A0ABV3GEJ8_MICGL
MSDLPTDRLLERDSEISALSAGVEGAGAGIGSFFVVIGPSGIGKTRLLGGARRMASEGGLRVLAANGSPFEREYAFGLVRQLFEGVLMRADDAEREQLLSGATAEVRHLFGLAFGLTAGEGAHSSEMNLFHGLFWLTVNICRRSPVLLAVDDLHWADDASLRFLAYLQRRLRDVRLMVVAATRPSDPAAAEALLDVVLTYPECRMLQPRPLSEAAVGIVLGEILGETPGPEVVSAYHAATGGNPLLLVETVRALGVRRAGPAGMDDARISEIGTRAVGRHVSVELGRLSPAARRTAEMVTVLGRHADVGHIAALTGLDYATVQSAVHELEDAHILSTESEDASVGFVHPVVRSAVYERLDPADRVRCHLAAAALLTREGRRLDEAAGHLLALPSPEPEHVAVLRQAAKQALERGTPESAHVYLAHALTGSMGQRERLDLLREAITAALLVDGEAALGHLDVALRLTHDPVETGELLCLSGLTKSLVGRSTTMIAQMVEAITRLPDDADDLRRGLEAALLDAPLAAVGAESVLRRIPELVRLPRSDTLNAALLECMIAGNECYAGDPRGAARAQAALRHPQMLEAAAKGATAGLLGHFTLMVGDPDRGIDAYGLLIAEVRRRGSSIALGTSLTCRAMGWLRKGELAEAENDLREVIQIRRISPVGTVLTMAQGLLAEVLVEQGRIDEASEILQEADLPAQLPQNGIFYTCLHARARILATGGFHDRALDAALAAGSRFAGHNGINPAIVAWRSQAALCLHALGEPDRARAYADEEIELAERWGAPDTIGRALRVAGLVGPPSTMPKLLERSVEVLRRSPARLELAHALVDLGACERRNGHLSVARALLYEGMEIAQRCHAVPLAKSARSELAATGARPRRSYLTGPESLTPSEARVVGLAADGLTNSQIAQRLYITVKTVEVHLSNAYQKLGIRRRHQLRDALPAQV